MRTSDDVTAPDATQSFDRRLIAPLVSGAVLNPINSTIVSVALVPIGVALGRLSLQRHQPQLQTERPRIECAALIACQQTDADEAHEMRKRLGGRHARRSRETRHGANGDLDIANVFAVDKALEPGLTWLRVVGEVAAVVRHAGQA